MKSTPQTLKPWSQLFKFAMFVILVGVGQHALAFFAPVSQRDARHFEGERYLALANIKVHESRSEKSAIVGDIARWRMVYAVPSGDPAWLRITGAGSSAFPQPFRGMAGSSTLGLVDGKLNKPTPVDRDTYLSHIGFVPSENLAPMERGIENFQIDGVRLPSLWASIGVEETRFLSVDKDAQPFDSVLQLLIRQQDGTLRQFCSAFYVEGGLLIGSAGHCFYAPSQMNETLKNEIENIRKLASEGKVLARAVNSNGEDIFPVELINGEATIFKNLAELGTFRYSHDWALLRASRKPKYEPKYLALPSGRKWQAKGALQIMSLGYGADVEPVKRLDFGLSRPHATICQTPTSALQVYKLDEGNHSMHLLARDSECVTVQGDSGGPIVFYNEDAKRFELLGIVSWGDREYFKYMSEEAQKAYKANAAKIESRYGKTVLQDNPPGAAAVKKLVLSSTGMYAQNNGWILDEKFLAEVHKYTGKQNMAPATFGGFQTSHGGIQSGFNSLAVGKYRNENSSLNNSQARLRLMLSYEMEKFGTSLNSNYQQSKTLFDQLSPAELTKASIPHEVFRWNGEYFLTKELNYSAESKHSNILSERRQIIVVGGDLFLVDLAEQNEIIGVVRNFMNRYSGDLERARLFRGYNPKIESDQNSSPTAAMQQTAVAAELQSAPTKGEGTPQAVTGIPTVSPGALWREIIKSKGRNEKIWILSATNLEIGVPNSVDMTFAGEGGSFTDKTQKRLEAKIKAMKVGKSDRIVTYCVNENCWLSYNLAVRLHSLGFTNVNWMRSGYWGWLQEGLPVGNISK